MARQHKFRERFRQNLTSCWILFTIDDSIDDCCNSWCTLLREGQVLREIWLAIYDYRLSIVSIVLCERLPVSSSEWYVNNRSVFWLVSVDDISSTRWQILYFSRTELHIEIQKIILDGWTASPVLTCKKFGIHHTSIHLVHFVQMMRAIIVYTVQKMYRQYSQVQVQLR